MAVVQVLDPPGLGEFVHEQLAGLIAVLRAEQARRQAGTAVRRAAWKNLVFTGGPGSGKTRAARAITRLYTELGLLAFGHLREITAADLAGTTLQEAGTLVAEAARRSSSDVLMINDAHAWDPAARSRPASAPLPVPGTDRLPRSLGRSAGRDPGRAGRPGSITMAPNANRRCTRR